MNIFKKAYCRTFQGVMNLLLPMMPYREPKILNSVQEIANELLTNQIEKVMVVIDKGIEKLGLHKGVENNLKENNIEYVVYNEVIPNPTIDVIEKAVEEYISSGCKSLIAIGGGSVIDCAKGIGARIASPKKTLNKMKGLLKVKGELPKFFAVPTTAGTGSETTVSAVITDSETHHKFVINDFNLIPHYAVLDPELTVSLPPYLTATTGMDALTHAIEAYIGGAVTEKTKKYALDAARLVFDNLPKVVEDGKNVKARANMLRAAYLGGLAFTRSYVGYVHAIAHSLGGKYGVAHGEANAVLLPYVLDEYGSKIHKKLREMAIYCDIAKKYDSEEIASSKLINKIIEMNELFGIPKVFNCIKEDDISEMSKMADKEANPLYPVPVLMSAKELEKLYYRVKA